MELTTKIPQTNTLCKNTVIIILVFYFIKYQDKFIVEKDDS